MCRIRMKKGWRLAFAVVLAIPFFTARAQPLPDHVLPAFRQGPTGLQMEVPAAGVPLVDVSLDGKTRAPLHPSSPAVTVRVDPRIELMSVVQAVDGYMLTTPYDSAYKKEVLERSASRSRPSVIGWA